VDGIDPIKVAAGQRTLTAAELRTYIGTLGDTLPDQALLLAVLAGGQRMEQLLRVKVTDFDPETSTLRLWDGKGKRTAPREHLIPLAPRGAALVARLVERAREKESPLLFAAREGKQMVATTPGNRCGEISKDMGGEPFNLRDIRRTVETLLAGLGVSRDTRAQLMSHGLSGVQAVHYDRHGYTTEKRAALTAWEGALEQGGRASNVVTLRGAAVA
jgi:integrase